MAYDYNSVIAFQRDIASVHGGTTARSEFTRGVLEGSLFYSFIAPSLFNVDSAVADYYNVEPLCKKITSTVMTLDDCQTSVNRVGNNEFRDRRRYTPLRKSIGLALCKSDCNTGTAGDKWLEQTYKSGIAAGITLDSFFFNGLPEAGFVPLLQQEAVRVRNLTANTKYNALETLEEPAELAAFFEAIIDGMLTPQIWMGPIMKQLIGYNKSYGTGDNCATFWSCAMRHLADRLGRSIDQVESMFVTNKAFDHVKGIDPNAVDDKHSIFWVMDMSKFRQGFQTTPIYEDALAINSKWVEANIAAYFTGAQFTQLGAGRLYFGSIDHAKILECESILGSNEDACVPIDEFCLDFTGQVA